MHDLLLLGQGEVSSHTRSHISLITPNTVPEWYLIFWTSWELDILVIFAFFSVTPGKWDVKWGEINYPRHFLHFIHTVKWLKQLRQCDKFSYGFCNIWQIFCAWFSVPLDWALKCLECRTNKCYIKLYYL